MDKSKELDNLLADFLAIIADAYTKQPEPIMKILLLATEF